MYNQNEEKYNRGGSRRVGKVLQESVLIAFDFIWIVLLSDKNFAILLDPPLYNPIKMFIIRSSKRTSRTKKTYQFLLIFKNKSFLLRRKAEGLLIFSHIAAMECNVITDMTL